MTTTAPLVAIQNTIEAPESVNVATLHDTDIDALVDRYIFMFPQWCKGHVERSLRTKITICEDCGYIEEPTIAMRLFGDPGHPRQVPRYTADMGTAWCIIEALKKRDAAWGKFVSAMHLRYVDEASDGFEVDAVLYKLDARGVAIAALRAVRVTDLNGYLYQGKEASDA